MRPTDTTLFEQLPPPATVLACTDFDVGACCVSCHAQQLHRLPAPVAHPLVAADLCCMRAMQLFDDPAAWSRALVRTRPQ